MSLKKILIVSACLLPLAACEPDLGASDYNVENVGQLSTTKSGVVVFKREVKMHYYDQGSVSQGATTGAGTGALAGGLGGAALGQSGGSTAAGALIGAGLGAVLGYGIEKKTKTHAGIEYHIKIDKTGDVVTVSQGKEPEISVGSRVLIITPQDIGGTRYNSPRQMRSRVVPINY